MNNPRIPRSQCQVLRFDLPKLSPKDCINALDFKLRAAYPGYKDGLNYYTHWISTRAGMSVLVLIPQNRAITENNPETILSPDFPLIFTSAYEGNIILTGSTALGDEIHIYRERILSQSHFMPRGSHPFESLVSSLRTQHSEHKWYHLSGHNFLPWIGPDKPASLFHEKICTPEICPPMELKGLPKKSWIPLGLRLFFNLVVLTAAVGLIVGNENKFQKEKQLLLNEIHTLETEQKTQLISPQEQKDLEKRLKSLEENQGYPLPELFNRLSASQGGKFLLTGLLFKEGKLRLEGRGSNAVAVLESLRTDLWFHDLIPSSIRKNPSGSSEIFIFEGKVNFD